MDPTSNTAPLDNGDGAFEFSGRLDELDDQLDQLERHTSDDEEGDPQSLRATVETLLIIARTVLGLLREQLQSVGSVGQLAVYRGQAPALNGRKRARIQVGNATLGTEINPSLDADSLRVGQPVWVDDKGTQVTAPEKLTLAGARSMRVLRDFHELGERYLEVEEPGREDVKHTVSLSDDLLEALDGRTLGTGEGVWVKGEWALKLDPDFKDRKSFLEERRWPPGGWQHAIEVKFSDIFGQERAKRILKTLVYIVCLPKLFAGHEFLGNTMRLLAGMPGQGKSMLARAFAWALHRRLGDLFQAILIPADAIKDKYVGNSGKNFRALFEEALKAYLKDGVTTLLVFEEFEALGVSRDASGDNTGVSQNLVALMLPYLDGAVRLTGVIVLALTNFPSLLDKGLTRSGRLGGRNFVPVDRIGPGDMIAIVEHQVTEVPHATDDWEPEDYGQAVQTLMDVKFGSVKAANRNIDILGSHMASGSLATETLRAGLSLSFEHKVAVLEASGALDDEAALLRSLEEEGQTTATPFATLSPAFVYQGAMEAIHHEIKLLAGDENKRRAREFFSGDLASADDLAEMDAVRLVPLVELPKPPAEYDLTPARELETPSGGA